MARTSVPFRKSSGTIASVQRKFMSGFTIVKWLANSGNCIREGPAVQKNRKTSCSAHSGYRNLLNDGFLQPWFVGLETAKAIRRLLPRDYFLRMREYFDKWGCLICSKNNREYGANGMCSQCSQRIQKRLFSIQVKSFVAGPPAPEHVEYDRVQGARILLSDLLVKPWSPKQMKLRKMKRD